MAEIAGKLGAIYYSTGYLYSDNISFADNNPSDDTITNTDGLFVTSGFQNGDDIRVSGSTSNDGLYTLGTSGVTTQILTLSATGTLTNEPAGDWVSIYTQEPGTQLAGFYNWSFDHSVDIEDITKFEDGPAGYKKKIAILKDWTATAEKYWQTTGNQETMLTGSKMVLVRFFVKYVSAPNGGDVAVYYQGGARVSGISPSSEVGAVIKQSITFEGDGPLTAYARDTAWPS